MRLCVSSMGIFKTKVFLRSASTLMRLREGGGEKKKKKSHKRGGGKGGGGIYSFKKIKRVFVAVGGLGERLRRFRMLVRAS